MKIKEVWKDIKGFEHYQVSNLGNVKSVAGVNERILTPAISNKRKCVRLYKDKVPTAKSVGVLVAEAFHNYNKRLGKVKYKNDNPMDVRSANITFKHSEKVSRTLNRVIIAGCRDFKDYPRLEMEIDFMLQNLNTIDTEIVSGKQCTKIKHGLGKHEKYGADYLGEVYARAKGINIIPFEADWNRFGKSAGPVRNREMAEYATHLIAFPSKKSTGTRNMISSANEMGLKVYVVEI